jgi:hypothetical protein
MKTIMNISKINDSDAIESSLEGNQAILQGGFCEFVQTS